MTIYTVGHSTHSLAELQALLQAFGVRQLADIRSLPRSRRNPQFNRESLPQALAPAGIAYLHLPALGGLRGHGLGDASPNGAWRNPSFRNYADYMATAAFVQGLEELLALGAQAPTAVMCAEAVPWRCHRSLVADALLVRGIAVRHILSPTRAPAHTLHPSARVQGLQITYPLL